MNEFEKQLARQPLKSIPPEWRAQILKEARGRVAPHVPSVTRQPWSWLHELFWPNPQAWGALAAIWIVIAAIQLITPGSARVQDSEVAKSHIISVSEQRRELARLLDGAKPEHSPADRPRTARVVPQVFV